MPRSTPRCWCHGVLMLLACSPLLPITSRGVGLSLRKSRGAKCTWGVRVQSKPPQPHTLVLGTALE